MVVSYFSKLLFQERNGELFTKEVFMEQNQTSRLPGKHPKSSERVSSFWLLWGHLAKQRLCYCSQLFFCNFLVKDIGMFQQGDNFSTMEIRYLTQSVHYAHPNWKLQRSPFPKNAERSTTHLAYKTQLSIKKAYMYVLKYSCASLLVCTTVSLVLYPGRVHNVR